MLSSSVHVAADGRISFFMVECYSLVCMYQIFFIQSFIDGHLGCYHVLAIVNNASVNGRADNDFVFFKYIPRTGIAEAFYFFCLPLKCIHPPSTEVLNWT